MREPVYATIQDLDDYLEVTNYLPTEAAKKKALLTAQSDIDLYVGRSRGYNSTTGLVYDPTDTTTFDEFMVEDLVEATCAQVKYRLTMGDAFFMESPRGETQGPDYTQTKVPRISPESIVALRRHGIMPRYATGRA